MNNYNYYITDNVGAAMEFIWPSEIGLFDSKTILGTQNLCPCSPCSRINVISGLCCIKFILSRLLNLSFQYSEKNSRQFKQEPWMRKICSFSVY